MSRALKMTLRLETKVKNALSLASLVVVVFLLFIVFSCLHALVWFITIGCKGMF